MRPHPAQPGGTPQADSVRPYTQTRGDREKDIIKLVIPTEEQLDQVWAYRQECFEADSSMDGCGPLRFNESAQQWLADVRAYMDPATVPEGKVQATQFLAIRESDSRLVGMLQVRHTLNDYLRQFGGHIGYSVRPGERRKGYGKEQLRLALDFCKGTLGLDRVLITCKTENEASRRTILSAGGVYENTLHEPGQGIDLERYWITL